MYNPIPLALVPVAFTLGPDSLPHLVATLAPVAVVSAVVVLLSGRPPRPRLP